MDRASENAKRIFIEATELTEPERDEFLAGACAGDAELEARVRRLLQAHARAEAMLSDSQDAEPLPMTLWQEDLEPGEHIGSYELVRELGEGGFGTVWLAEQQYPIQRPVALKVLKAGLDTREVIARFEAERQALALMDHPCIAKVFAGGTAERGRPFFAMELVDGPPITDYCENNELGLSERLELFVQVSRAVQHAHQKGVIHRDIKPTNVLVSETDGRSIPKVIDFGIAKAIERPLTAKTLFTIDGQVIGTPTYMSPEQMSDATDVDTRTDVYALGVLLYELLVGATPFDQSSLRDGGFAELVRVIREVDPPKPSTRLERRSDSRSLSRRIRGDLDWIVMKCLEKDRGRRYDSADVLANDIERHLRGAPVLAGPPNVSYRLTKFVRRYRTALAVTLAMFALLAGGIVVSTSQARRAWRAEASATEEARRAQEAEKSATEEARRATLELSRSAAIASFFEHLLMSIDPAHARGEDTVLLRQVLDRAASGVASEFSDTPEVEATLRRSIGGAYKSIAEYGEAEKQLGRALELREASLGPEHVLTLQSAHELGGLLGDVARYEEAEHLLARAFEGRRRLLGEDDLETLKALGNLAVALSSLGRVEEAESMLRDLELRLNELFGDEHEETIRAMNNLASLLEEVGQSEEALERYQLALDLQLEIRDPLDPRTLAALNNLGSLYQNLGRFEEAEEHLSRALDGKRRVLPEGHPSLLISMNNLAKLEEQLGRPAAAEALYVEAIEAGRRQLGDSDRRTMSLRFNHALLRLRLGRVEETEKELREIVTIGREVLDPGDPLMTSMQNALAEAHRVLGIED